MRAQFDWFELLFDIGAFSLLYLAIGEGVSTVVAQGFGATLPTALQSFFSMSWTYVPLVFIVALLWRLFTRSQFAPDGGRV